MGKKRLWSTLWTLVCAVLILSLGYLGIVESGKRLLSNEEKPEKVTFENTGSHIFYGEIGDDIQLYPWNYYDSGEEVSMEEVFAKSENLLMLEYILQCMEAYNCDEEVSAVISAYDQKQSGIAENFKAYSTEYGFYMFYQDILEIEGRHYQIKAACDDWGLISFSCMEYREEDERETEEWREGKKQLTEMLDGYKDIIGEQMFDMNYPYREKILGDAYLGAYIENMERMNSVLTGKYPGNAYGDVNEISGDMAVNIGKNPEYSYQVIELQDKILLLIQGDYTVGLFYDPISRKFCGYNYFMKW